MDDSKRILIVDDDESIRELMARLLSPPYEVEFARHGEEALDCIRRRPPDLVVLDLRMPVMDGWELLERLEQGGEDVGVVLLSGEELRPWPKSRLVRAGLDKRRLVVALRDTCSRLLAGEPPQDGASGASQP